MKTQLKLIAVCHLLCVASLSVQAFEGRITAARTRRGQTQTFTYTVGTNMLRIERNETNRSYARNLISLDSGDITLLFPHNRSFVQLKADDQTVAPGGFPHMHLPRGGLPPGIGPQSRAGAPARLSAPHRPTAHIGPRNLPSMREMPAMSEMPSKPESRDAAMPALPEQSPTDMDSQRGADLPSVPRVPTPPASAPINPTNLHGIPEMPAMPGRMPDMSMMPGPEGGPEGGWPGEAPQAIRRRASSKLQFSATGETTNLLGYACTRYELRQWGQIMEIWATDQLMPFHRWLPDPPPRHHGPTRLEESWGNLLQARKLFPMLIQMKNEDGKSLLFTFKVISVVPKHLGAEEAKLLQPPTDYHELAPPRF